MTSNVFFFTSPYLRADVSLYLCLLTETNLVGYFLFPYLLPYPFSNVCLVDEKSTVLHSGGSNCLLTSWSLSEENNHSLFLSRTKIVIKLKPVLK